MAYGDALASDARVDGNVPVVGSGGVSGSHNSPNFRGPAIVVGRKGSYGSVHWISSDGFAIDTSYFIDSCLTRVNLRWLYYVLLAIDLKGPSQDVGVPGLSREFAYSTLIPAPPPLEEQRRIADFLDAETSRIDQLVSARKRQIQLLEDRNLAAIGSMLSGAGCDGPRRATGWDWLPEVPATWGIGPIYAYFDTELGKMLNPERAGGDRQRPYLRNANVGWFKINTDDVATMEFTPSEVRRYSLNPGDLLVCEGGAGVAEAGVWDGRIDDCYFQKSLHRVRSRGELPVEWLMYWLRLAKTSGVFDAGGNLATIPHLTGEQLRRYRIPIPVAPQPLIEELSSTMDSVSSACSTLLSALHLLSERRQALITAAVTGQFDVTTASGRNTTQGV